MRITRIKKYMRLSPKILSLALLITVASCSGSTEDTANTTQGSEDTASSAASQGTVATTENTSPAKAPPDSPSPLSPDPAFDPLLGTLEQMTTAPIMLPATLPTQLKSVVIGNDPNNASGPYTTGGDKYTILFLNPDAYPPPDPSQIVQPYAHYRVAGTLTASPSSAPEPNFGGGGATVYQLENVALPDGAVANLQRVVPPQGANAVPFTVGTFEEEGERYTLRIETDTPEGDLARQALSTMVRVPGN